MYPQMGPHPGNLLHLHLFSANCRSKSIDMLFCRMTNQMHTRMHQVKNEGSIKNPQNKGRKCINIAGLPQHPAGLRLCNDAPEISERFSPVSICIARRSALGETPEFRQLAYGKCLTNSRKRNSDPSRSKERRDNCQRSQKRFN